MQPKMTLEGFTALWIKWQVRVDRPKRMKSVDAWLADFMAWCDYPADLVDKVRHGPGVAQHLAEQYPETLAQGFNIDLNLRERFESLGLSPMEAHRQVFGSQLKRVQEGLDAKKASNN